MYGVKANGRLLIGAMLAISAWSQTGPDQRSSETPDRYESRNDKAKRGPGREVGSGAGDVGKGAAKGAGHLGKGAAVGAGDLVTLRPVSAGVAVGKGAGYAGKDVAVGTVKGTGKIAHGIGRAVGRLF